jgi:hypothetical protein
MGSRSEEVRGETRVEDGSRWTYGECVGFDETIHIVLDLGLGHMDRVQRILVPIVHLVSATC